MMVEAKDIIGTGWIEPQTFAEAKPQKNKEPKFKTEICFYKTENPNDTITQNKTVEDPGIDSCVARKLLFFHTYSSVKSCEAVSFM